MIGIERLSQILGQDTTGGRVIGYELRRANPDARGHRRGDGAGARDLYDHTGQPSMLQPRSTGELWSR
jgi:hypothetical protein